MNSFSFYMQEENHIPDAETTKEEEDEEHPVIELRRNSIDFDPVTLYHTHHE